MVARVDNFVTIFMYPRAGSGWRYVINRSFQEIYIHLQGAKTVEKSPIATPTRHVYNRGVGGTE